MINSVCVVVIMVYRLHTARNRHPSFCKSHMCIFDTIGLYACDKTDGQNQQRNHTIYLPYV